MVSLNDQCLDPVVQGAVNLRDLGGYRAGPASVRTGMVYRSGMTHTISHTGLQALAERCRLRTVIDLRSTRERDEDGLASFDSLGAAHHHVAITDEISAPAEEQRQRFAEMRAGTFDWTDSYVRMLRGGGLAFRRFFDIIAAPEALPALFHCTAGRDRTGVAAALLLRSLGVSDGDVAGDYARTGMFLRPHVGRFMRQAERFSMTDDEMVRLLETRAEAMLALLDLLTHEYGSAAGYLSSIGVDAGQMRTIRDTLLIHD